MLLDHSRARLAAVMLAAFLGAALAPAAAGAHQLPVAAGQAGAAGGATCTVLEWAVPPAGAGGAFILANSVGTVWRTVRPPLADGRGEACEAGLPAGRYMVCEVTGPGFAIVPLPTAGQKGSETCVALTLGDGEAAQVAFRNVPLAPARPPEPAESPLPGLPNTGSGGAAARP